MSNQRDYYDPDTSYGYDYNNQPSRSTRPSDSRSEYAADSQDNYNDQYYRPQQPRDKQYPRDPSYDLGRSRGASDNREGDEYQQSLARYDNYRQGRRSTSRRRRDDYSPSPEPSEGYSESRAARSRSRGSRPESRQKLDGYIGKEKKDLVATVIGALAGGFLAHEATGGKRPLSAVGGALLGGLAGNAIEHEHLKKSEIRRDREKEKKGYEY